MCGSFLSDSSRLLYSLLLPILLSYFLFAPLQGTAKLELLACSGTVSARATFR